MKLASRLALVCAAAALSACNLHIPPPPGIPTPTVAATASTPSPTVAPASTSTPAPRSAPFPTIRPTVPSTCTQAPSTYNPTVRRAISAYQSAHPDYFDGNLLLFKDSQGNPITQDQFIWGVSAILGQYGLDSIEDPCLCGDMAVADSSTPQGSGFAEQYHPISSKRLVQQAPYLERCTPRWF